MKVRLIIDVTIDEEAVDRDDPLAAVLAYAWEAFDAYGETTSVDTVEG